MHTDKLILPLVLAPLISLCTTEAVSQSYCTTAEQIETLNQNVIEKRLAHIRGTAAIVLIALDPVWSMPEFSTLPYRHPDEMTMIKDSFSYLVKQGIDEIVVWDFGGLGAAVPFRDGCVVYGYGEPDDVQKITMMYETYRHIVARGLDDPTIREDLERLLMFELSPYQDDSLYDASMIDIMVDKLRPLVKKLKSSDGEEILFS